MVKKFAFVTDNGRVVYTMQPSDASGYFDGMRIEEAGYTCRELPDGCDDVALARDGYWKDGWKMAPARPAPYMTWDLQVESWIDPRKLEDVKADVWATIKKARLAAEAAGFEWDGSQFQSDSTSQARIQAKGQEALMAKMTGQAFTAHWTLADNSVRKLDADQMMSVCVALGRHIDTIYTYSQALREKLDSAEKIDDALKVAW